MSGPPKRRAPTLRELRAEIQDLRDQIAELTDERDDKDELAEAFVALRRDLDAAGLELPFAVRLAFDEFGLRIGAPR